MIHRARMGIHVRRSLRGYVLTMPMNPSRSQSRSPSSSRGLAPHAIGRQTTIPSHLMHGTIVGVAYRTYATDNNDNISGSDGSGSNGQGASDVDAMQRCNRLLEMHLTKFLDYKHFHSEKLDLDKHKSILQHLTIRMRVARPDVDQWNALNVDDELELMAMAWKKSQTEFIGEEAHQQSYVDIFAKERGDEEGIGAETESDESNNGNRNLLQVAQASSYAEKKRKLADILEHFKRHQQRETDYSDIPFRMLTYIHLIDFCIYNDLDARMAMLLMRLALHYDAIDIEMLDLPTYKNVVLALLKQQRFTEACDFIDFVAKSTSTDSNGGSQVLPKDHLQRNHVLTPDLCIPVVVSLFTEMTKYVAAYQSHLVQQTSEGERAKTIFKRVNELKDIQLGFVEKMKQFGVFEDVASNAAVQKLYEDYIFTCLRLDFKGVFDNELVISLLGDFRSFWAYSSLYQQRKELEESRRQSATARSRDFSFPWDMNETEEYDSDVLDWLDAVENVLLDTEKEVRETATEKEQQTPGDTK